VAKKYIRFHYTFSHDGLWLKRISYFSIVFSHGGLWLKSVPDFCTWAYGKEKMTGAERNLPDFFGLCPRCQKKFSVETFQNCCLRGGGGGGGGEE
jgi:hypothetical protein